MISFKNFLQEASAGEEPNYERIDILDAVVDIKTHCKNAIWMIKSDRIIWRGDYRVDRILNSDTALLVDTTATERMSENTANHYTLLLDNNPANAAFPKRSRSFICSEDKSSAQDFGSKPFVVIPYDTAKIGDVKRIDLWATKMNMFGSSDGRTIDQFNEAFREITELKRPDWQSFVDFDKKLKAGDEKALSEFRNFLSELTPPGGVDKAVEKFKNVFLETLMKAYDYKKLGMACYTTANFPPSGDDNELWIGGKVVILSVSDYRELRREHFRPEQSR